MTLTGEPQWNAQLQDNRESRKQQRMLGEESCTVWPQEEGCAFPSLLGTLLGGQRFYGALTQVP